MFPTRHSRLRSPRLVSSAFAAPILAGAMLLFAAPATHAQNLLVNGSFENGTFTGANPNGAGDITQLNPGATNITGWTVLSGGNVSDIAWNGNNNPYTGAASNGIRYLDLTGFRDTPPFGGVTQTVSLIQGNTYRLSFDLGSFESNGLYRGPVSARAIVGSLDQVFTFTPTTGSTGQQWGTFTSVFTATTAASTLQISGISTAGGQFLGLDNVSVTAVTGTAAPEPGSLALMGMSALPLTGLVLRRRRK